MRFDALAFRIHVQQHSTPHLPKVLVSILYSIGLPRHSAVSRCQVVVLIVLIVSLIEASRRVHFGAQHSIHLRAGREIRFSVVCWLWLSLVRDVRFLLGSSHTLLSETTAYTTRIEFSATTDNVQSIRRWSGRSFAVSNRSIGIVVFYN
jgi:hypothetical protein